MRTLTGAGCRCEPTAFGTAIEKYLFGVITEDSLARSHDESLIAFGREMQNLWTVRLYPRRGTLPRDLGLRI